jgi:MFS family permease
MHRVRHRPGEAAGESGTSLDPVSPPAVLRGQLLRAFAVFEIGNLAATLLILRATDLLTPGHGLKSAIQIALALYTGYNVAATVVTFRAGRASDRLGRQGPLVAVAIAVVAFLASYVLFATSGAVIGVLTVAFLAAGVWIGCAETAEHAAVAVLAPQNLRGFAFGLWRPCTPRTSPRTRWPGSSTPSSPSRSRSATSPRAWPPRS